MAKGKRNLVESGHKNGRPASTTTMETSSLEEYVPETPLGRKLMELHREIVASGQPLLDSWEDLEREIAERRGGQFKRQ